MKGSAKNMNSNIKYFLYARKSSENEDRQVQSITDQINRLKELASDLNLKIIRTFKESKSARKPNNRPIFEEMIRRIENGDANGILCWHINRLSRNPIDSGKIHWLLQEEIIKSIQTINRNHLPEDNAILFSVETGEANQYIRDLSKNVKRGMESKRQKGGFPHLARIGYLNDKLEHTIVKDPERFDLIRKMWDLMLTGNYTPPKILKIVNDEWGFRTRKFKRIGGNKLSRSGIYNIFTSPFYKGTTIFGNGTEYKGKHEPMVTEEEFEIVQVLLGRKLKSKPKKHTFAYTGFIRCGECGCLYTAQINKKLIKTTGKVKEYTYYHCTRKKADIDCSQRKSVREDVLEAQIEEELEKYTILPEFRNWALEVISESHEKEVNDRKKILAYQQKTYKDIQNEIDKLIDMKLKDQVSEEEYNAKRSRLLDDKSNIKARLDENDQRADEWLKLTERAFNFVTNAREAFVNGDNRIKKDILMALGKRITIIDEKLSIETNEWLVPIKEDYPALEEEYLRLKPEKNLLYSGVSSNLEPIRTRWLGREDSNLRSRDQNPLPCHLATPH